ncbi:hypothetical protein PHYBLDRAFT_65928 [Phycomyces blakesleeanus NRRL 1555(-)]|uniref:Uncharacterized protein n=1 Tax=Phycomyces blakesleeanus (strain ATCC 8743b / DSM 1359 / FGSC 10004 / NBRC 33097 / NRRL 1555) TaxID=763407 RepID=A0A163AGH3_PHYB8|nr:hypothetical protein PHYBLDRAFT_65928 [Phycomyces blakesleeanus NRRL 1555(-)]OAD73321.1 hypothetical protein PHYBLDRAFT_65928 [Phycomyces blakesleeanus NRRL 1555(-)]|eukprot:XP_018291361.1 hypothetical protein PHYBLDRAFT_65928 [Phycomyces blakesleeanus NRRL 1555(-)]
MGSPDGEVGTIDERERYKVYTMYKLIQVVNVSRQKYPPDQNLFLRYTHSKLPTSATRQRELESYVVSICLLPITEDDTVFQCIVESVAYVRFFSYIFSEHNARSEEPILYLASSISHISYFTP